MNKISKVLINKDKCIGTAVCVSIDPEDFTLDPNNKAEFSGKPKADDETILLAAQSCPTQAISVFDKNGNKINY